MRQRPSRTESGLWNVTYVEYHPLHVRTRSLFDLFNDGSLNRNEFKASIRFFLRSIGTFHGNCLPVKGV